MESPETQALRQKLDTTTAALTMAEQATHDLESKLDDSVTLVQAMQIAYGHSDEASSYIVAQKIKRNEERQFYSVDTNVQMHNYFHTSDSYQPPQLTPIEAQIAYVGARGSIKHHKNAVKKAQKRKEYDRQRQLERYEASYTELKERVKAGDFSKIDRSDLDNEWVSKNVLDKKVKVPGSPNEKMTNRELYDEAISGNYSHLEFLDPVLRLQLATQYMNELKIGNVAANSKDATPAGFIEKLVQANGVSALMHPLFRLGVSIGMKSQDMPPIFYQLPFSSDDFREMEDLLNARIMSETITSIPKISEVEQLYGVDSTIKVGDSKENDARRSAMLESLERNRKSQIFMAKLLLTAHIRGITKTSNGTSEDWNYTMSTAFAHCSRVGIILPGQKVEQGQAFSVTKEKKTIDSLTGADGGLKAGFFRRGAATHSLRKKSKKRGGDAYKEKKTLGTFSNQFGMNVAIGGLGASGISGAGGQARLLDNDGSCGHIYMHKQIGDSSSYTSLLVGFESDSYQKTNQLGHTHGFGNGEYASSFGGMRVDEIGDKYGGRTMDLSKVDADIYQELMQLLENKLESIYDNPTQDNLILLRKISSYLAGKEMNYFSYIEFLKLIDAYYDSDKFMTIKRYRNEDLFD